MQPLSATASTGIFSEEIAVTDYAEPITFFYTEKSTRFLYEVQFFEGFVLHRPATPEFSDVLTKVSYRQFEEEFEEFLGDADLLRDHIEGWGAPAIIVY